MPSFLLQYDKVGKLTADAKFGMCLLSAFKTVIRLHVISPVITLDHARCNECKTFALEYVDLRLNDHLAFMILGFFCLFFRKRRHQSYCGSAQLYFVQCCKT